MNDPKLLRTETAAVRQGIQNRSGRYLPYLEEFLKIDEEHRALQREVEELRAKRNASSEKIGKAKQAKDETEAKRLMAEVAKIKEAMAEKEKELEPLSSRIRECLLSIPNLPHSSVPVGKSETENVEKRKGGPAVRKFDFKPLDHQTLGEGKLDILSMGEAAKLSGSRFALWKGDGAKLIRSIINFQLDLHIKKHGYYEIWPPYLVRPETLEGTGQLPKFQEDLYKTVSSDGDKTNDMFLIPTAEVPLTNLVRESILPPEKPFPIKYVAYTPCFRQEAGSYGKDVRGVIRNHQFDKVELVWITRPEDSVKAIEGLIGHAEAVLAALEIPYRVIELCTADLGFASCKTYDLEVWMPAEARYREISSCSNCGDFQARRMNARFRRGPKDSPEFLHTLNGSGVAVGRLAAAILENFQQKDGSVEIPKALRPYFGADVVASVN